MGAPGPMVHRRAGARIRGYLRAHPILCLALLTPGIPEYLSGSSSPAVLVANPLLFGLFLALNVGMYTGGVLLIREARVRWRLGLASVLALGLAYGIAEEGFALTTLFDPHNGQVSPSTAGAWGGVNWGWTSGILPFHAVFSVALPLFLLDRAFPELRTVSLVQGRQLLLTAVVYLATIGSLGIGFALRTYWMGTPVLLGAAAAVLGLVLLARALPASALTLPRGSPSLSPRQAFLAGATVFPLLLIVPGLVATLHPPILLLALTTPVLGGLYLLLLLPRLGSAGGAPVVLALATGMIAPLFVSGELIGFFRDPLGVPVVVLTDVVGAAFLWRLYRTAAAPGPPSRAVPPAGALLGA